jgi:hypothetical protein
LCDQEFGNPPLNERLWRELVTGIALANVGSVVEWPFATVRVKQQRIVR